VSTGEQILLLMRECSKLAGMTIVMVTTKSLAEKFANRIAVLSDGRLVSEGEAKEDARPPTELAVAQSARWRCSAIP